MNKPSHQKIFNIIKWTVQGIGVIVVFITATVTLIEYLNFKNVLWGTILVVLIYFVFTFYLQKWPIPWRYTATYSRISKLGPQITFGLGGALICCWVLVVYKELITQNKIVTIPKNPVPIFKEIDSSFKILILPFDEDCIDPNGIKVDVGSLIYKRLSDLNVLNSMNLKLYYFHNFKRNKNLDRAKLEAIRKYNSADLMLYGTHWSKECVGKDSGFICYNYVVDSSKFKNIVQGSFVLNEVKYSSSLLSIMNGNGQHQVEYIIFKISALAEVSIGNFDKAIILLKKIKEYDKYPEILFEIGQCYLSLTKNIEAEVIFKKILNQNSGYKNANLRLATVYFYMGKEREMLHFLDSAKKYDNDDPWTWNILGGYYLKNGEMDQAKLYFYKGLQLESSSIAIWNNLGNLYLLSDSNSRAKYCFQKALLIDSLNEFTLCNLANLYSQLGDYSKTVHYINQAIKRNKRSVAIFNQLGEIYLFKLHNYKSAIDMFNRALQIDQRSINALYYLQLAYHIGNNHNQAIIYCRKLLQVDSTYVKGWISLGMINTSAGRYRDSEFFFKKALSIEPSNSQAWFNLSYVYMQLDNKSKSKKCLEQAKANGLEFIVPAELAEFCR
ncbi:tetratricopeptide repeat protein [Candidatus Dojkabacteria bacterium]|nr:tetratricopeptide repeat protein [Bacteroidia bacterium]MBP9759618.1 tetratricopeptide repeat protein [Candidatus Dojkabacteria bacterium]